MKKLAVFLLAVGLLAILLVTACAGGAPAPTTTAAPAPATSPAPAPPPTTSAAPAPTTAKPAPTSTAPPPATTTTAPPAPAKVYNLKIQSGWPRGDMSMEALSIFADAAAKRSNGQLKIQVFAAPEIVGMFEVPDAVKAGTIDMEMSSGGIWSGIIPVGDIEFGLPYGYRIPEAQTFMDKLGIIRKFFYEGGFAQLLRDEYAKQGVYWLDLHTYGPVPFICATKPIQTLSDIKGLRIRTDSLWMTWQNAMGMNGQDISGDEAYMALKNGTVNAHVWDMSVYTGMGFEEVAPYWIRGMEDDHAIGHIVVNMKIWQSLPPDLQQALAGAAEDYYKGEAAIYDKEFQKVLDKVKSGVVKEVQLDKDVIALAEKTGYAIWDEQIPRSPASAKAIEMIKKWRGVK